MNKSVRLFARLILVSCVAVFPSGAFAFREFMGSERTVRPDLLYPMTNDISLAGKDTLDFRWEEADYSQTDHYELRLYNGYDTTASGLILKQDVRRSPAKISAGYFKEGQVYSWSLRQIIKSGRRGDYSYGSFKVINK